MATFNIEFSMSDEHMDRVTAALKMYFGAVLEHTPEGIPIARELTNEEVFTKLRQMYIDNIKTIVVNYEADEAIAIVKASVNAIVIE